MIESINTTSAPRIILVLGMHRSGTSAITKSLELLGVGLGSNLYPAQYDNPKGYWEDKDCIEINQQLLKYLNSEYRQLDLAWEELPPILEIDELKTKAINLVTQKLADNNGVWGFKDPRTCRLLKFWSHVFSEVGCDVSVVIAIRNPASVVASFSTRDAIPKQKAYFLWLQHVVPSLTYFTNAKRVVVDYDELMADPYLQISRMSAELDLPLPQLDSLKVNEYKNIFLEKNLRHAIFDEETLAADSHASSILVDLYSFLRRVSKDHDDLDNPVSKKFINEINKWLKQAQPIFAYVNALEKELETINKTSIAQAEVIANQQKEIELIYNSRSWKITQPLRFIESLRSNK